MDSASSILAAYAARAPWLDKDTVDRLIFGDPEKPVHKLLVTWQADEASITFAGAHKYDALMVHEPTFWFHRDEWDNVQALPDDSAKKRAALTKAAQLERFGLVVLRNHDVWDAMPEVGIPWAWAAHLELRGRPTATRIRGMMHRYDLAPRLLAEFAAHISRRTALLGDIPPAVFGNPAAVIRTVGIGTGCITDMDEFAAMGCDVAVVCDDGSAYWHDVAWALETGLAVIRVSHGTSEEPGMMTLAKSAECMFPECEVGYFPHSLHISTPV